MSAWVRGVSCPGCYRMLYTLALEDGDAEWVHKGASIQMDATGAFVRCPHCRSRISHRKAEDVPGFGYEVIR
jgi:hypothetical protein